jgi:hypothetical protein
MIARQRIAKSILPVVAATALWAAAGAASPPAAPDDPRGPSAPATLDDLAWMAGRWAERSPTGGAVETWSRPDGGSMLGMCRIDAAGRPTIYELIVIEQRADGPVMLIRHFGPGLRSLHDEPNVLKRVRRGEAEAVFEERTEGKTVTITYRRDGADRLTVVLDKQSDGKRSESRFRFERIRGE